MDCNGGLCTRRRGCPERRAAQSDAWSQAGAGTLSGWCTELMLQLQFRRVAATRGHPHPRGCPQAKGPAGCRAAARRANPQCCSTLVALGCTGLAMVRYTAVATLCGVAPLCVGLQPCCVGLHHAVWGCNHAVLGCTMPCCSYPRVASAVLCRLHHTAPHFPCRPAPRCVASRRLCHAGLHHCCLCHAGSKVQGCTSTAMPCHTTLCRFGRAVLHRAARAKAHQGSCAVPCCTVPVLLHGAARAELHRRTGRSQ